MIKILEKIDNYIYMEVVNTITKEDVEGVAAIVEEMVKEYKKLKYLIVLNNVKGYSFEGFLADFNFYLKHKDAFDYIAVVGDKYYEKLIIEIMNKILPQKTKYFDISEFDKAKEWIMSV